MTDTPTPARPEEAIARVREELSDPFTGWRAGPHGKDVEAEYCEVWASDLRALLAYADALAQWKQDNQQAIIAATARCLSTGAVPDGAVSMQDAVDAICSELEETNGILAALRERLARAEADTARLDWLDDHGGFETPDGKDGMSMARWGRSSNLTLRAALDAARRPDPTEGTPDPTPARLPGDAQG